MPVDVTANFIRIRIASPSDFVRFRMKILGKGIKAVIGFRKKGGSAIQSFLFPRDRYSLAQARTWIKSHGYRVHETLLVYNFKNLLSNSVNDWFVEETVPENLLEEEEPKRPSKSKVDWLLEEAQKVLEGD